MKPGNASGGWREAKPGTGELAVRAAPRALRILHERHLLNKNIRREHERPQWVPTVTESPCCPSSLSSGHAVLSSQMMALHLCVAWSRNPSPEHLAAEGNRGQMLNQCRL